MYAKYILANEDRPNNFNPIYWIDSKELYDLKSIDLFTKDYTYGEFIRYLKLNGLIDTNKYSFQIVFNNNGIRRVKDGLMYKEDYNPNMLLYVKDFITNNIKTNGILNELYQHVSSDKNVEKYTKSILKVLFDNRHLDSEELSIIIEELNNSSYYDIRLIYFYIIRELINKKDIIKTLKNN